MGTTVPTALATADEPGFGPTDRPFEGGGGGGGGGFDIDSIYGASDVGDYYVTASEQYTDAGKTTAATTAGDLIYHWDGGKTAGTGETVAQATASNRPELAADGTYTLSTLYPAGALKWMGQGGYSKSIRLVGARFRLDDTTAGTNAGSGHAFGAGDFSSFSQCPAGIRYNLQLSSTTNTTSLGPILSDTDWHTVVVQWEEDGANNHVRMYLDDMTTPVIDTLVGGFPSLSNFRFGHNSPMQSGVHVHKTMAHGAWDAATPAELAAWLEA